MSTKSNNFAEDFAQRIINQLKEGKAPWQKPLENGQSNVPFNPISGAVYRGVNIIELASQGYEDSRWMTSKQANEAQYDIKDGSKPVQGVHYRFTDEVDKYDAQGQAVLKDDGTIQKETIRLESPIITMFNVFNAEQIEGMPALEKKTIDWNPEEKAAKIIVNSSVSIIHDQQDKSFYKHANDSIHLPPKDTFSNAQEFYSTVLREIVHSTGHRARMNRGLHAKGTENYAKEELRAEIASWMISQETGIPHNPNTEHVGSWIKVLEKDPVELMRACGDAEKIKEYVMGLEHNKELSKNIEHAAGQELKQDNVNDVTKDNKPEHLSAEKTALTVPYSEREQAKELGAKWDWDNKTWVAPEGSNLEALKQWIPEEIALNAAHAELPVEHELKQDNYQNVTKDNKSENLSIEKTYLDVPYSEKEQAKKLGAKWDFENKTWFAPEGSNLKALKQWIPENTAALSVPAAKSVESPENEFARK